MSQGVSHSGVSAVLASRMPTQAEFAELVEISEARMSQLMAEGAFIPGQSALTWLRGYLERLREAASGRDPDGTLIKERAGLAREQRIGQAIKNAVAQGEFAPIGLLSDILGLASGSVAQRLDALVPRLKLVWPDMPDAARGAIETELANARNEWVRATGELSSTRLDELAQTSDEEPAE